MESEKTKDLKKRKRNVVDNTTVARTSKWQKKVVKQYARAGVVHFHIYSLRTMPVTLYRVIKMIKLIFDGYTHIPFEIEISENQLQMLLNVYCQPLSPDSNEPRIVGGKIASMENLLMLLRGTELKYLQIYRYQSTSDLLQDAYKRIKTGNAIISLKQIEEIVVLILPTEKAKLVSLERLRSVFRKGSSVQMRELLNSYEYLLNEVDEDQEICMKFYFQCLETNCKEVAPSRECRVFYNEAGETLYIHSKQLMTEAEMNFFGEESGNNDVGSRDKNYGEKSRKVAIIKDFSNTNSKKSIPIPTDNVEIDKISSNIIEEPSPDYSDLSSNEMTSHDELLEIPRKIDDGRTANLPSVTPSALNDGRVPSPMNEQIPITTAATTLSSSEKSDDESPDEFPIKKIRVIENRRISTTLSSTVEFPALLSRVPKFTHFRNCQTIERTLSHLRSIRRKLPKWSKVPRNRQDILKNVKIPVVNRHTV